MGFRVSQTSRRTACAAAFALVTIALPVTAALAQDSVPTASDDDDIVVTAAKREQRLIEVPGAVTALDTASLIQSQRVSIIDFFPQVPGLSVSDSGNGRTSLTIRGVTTGNTQRATVGIVIDDIPFTPTGGTSVSPNLTPDLDPAILQRIEVLRGPQGTLYGAASLGGLLKYVTVAPSLDGIHGFAQTDLSDVRYGELGYSTRGALNAALVPGKVGISASMFYRRDPGFIDDRSRGLTDVNRVQNYGGRVELRFKLADPVDLRLSALTQLTDADGPSTILTDFALNRRVANYDFPSHRTTGDRTSRLQFYTANLNVDLGKVALTSLTGYMRNDFVQDTSGTLNQFAASTALFGVNGIYVKSNYSVKKFSQELRLSSTGNSALQWLVGGFFTDEDSGSLQQGFAIDPATGRTPGTFYEFYFPATFKEIAGFADLTLAVTDRLELQVGGRYSSNDQTYFEIDRGPRYNPPISFSRDSEDSVFTYLGSAKWEAMDDIFVYARVASGYRPGGPQTAAAGPVVPSQVDPDTTVNYELGLKGRTLGRALDFDIAGFQIDWSDIQLSQTLPDYGLFYINGGKARIRGVEASAQLRPARGTSLGGNVTYTDSELRTAGVGFVGAAGDRLPSSAKWQWNVNADQDIVLNAKLRAFAGVTASHVGGRSGPFATAATNVRQFFPSYTTLDARVGVTIDDRYTVTVFGRNLTDKLGFLGSSVVQGAANRTASYATSIIRPRTVGVSFGARF